MLFTVPLGVLLVTLIWLYLVVRFKVPFRDLPPGHPVREAVRGDLGPTSQAERRVSAVFALAVLGWIMRRFVLEWLGWEGTRFSDESVAIAVTVVLFVVKARNEKGEV